MTRISLIYLLPFLLVACDMTMEDEIDSFDQELGVFYYAASNTNSASDPVYSADFLYPLEGHKVYMIGTSIITESFFSGDTYLRLYDDTGTTLLAYNDDISWPSNPGSKMSFAAPATDDYLVRAGCYSSSACDAMVAISELVGLQSFSTTNTFNAYKNTFNKHYYLYGGQVVRVSTCGSHAYGASSTGDTYLRLFSEPSYTQVAENDNATGCGSAAEIVYTIPTTGFYQVRAGCYSNTSCSGTFAVYTE